MKKTLLCGWLMMGVVWGTSVQAGTWKLDPQGEWQNAADVPGDDLHPALTPVRQALASDDEGAVVEALETLKTAHPELAGGDLDAFIAAEKVYAKGNLGKAGKLYKVFLEKWPDSIFQPAVMERYFSIGAAFLQGQKRVFLGVLRLPAFDDGVTIMRVIADKAGNSPMALRALQVTAENLERRQKFIDAYHTWAEISVRWPTGAEGRDALLRMGRALHASYGGAEYDVTVLEGAKSYFEDFSLRYPQLAEELNLASTVEMITEQTAYKQYETGFYYERLGNMNAAQQHYLKVIAQWPDSSAARMAASRLDAEAEPAVKMTFGRKLINVCGIFLDNWFGLKPVFSPKHETSADIKS